MVLCVGVCMVLGLGAFVLRKHKIWKTVRSPCLIMLAFSVVALLLYLLQKADAAKVMEPQIARNPPGKGVLETEAVFYMEGEEEGHPISFRILEQSYGREKEKELLTAAMDEIQETFCGDNASLDEIVQNPKVDKSYQNGAVEAEWIFSESDCISEDGKISQEALGNEKQRIEAVVLLSCGESEEFYRFFFWIVPQEKSKQEKVAIEIKNQIAQQEESKAVVELPTVINGESVEWKKTGSTQWMEVLGYGVLMAVAAWYVAREQKQRKVQHRRQQLMLSYPEFVSKLSLLLGAGMTISAAFRKMNGMYQKRKERDGRKEAVYEELHRMICEMDNGMTEFRAYQRFSENCDLQPYRKLVSLLISSQRVGNRRLMEQLNEEADRVFLERKNAARRLGEEAGTKLLFPMMMMLVIVMGIVIVPAFLSIYG